jgi:hypothetical protein
MKTMAMALLAVISFGSDAHAQGQNAPLAKPAARIEVQGALLHLGITKAEVERDLGKSKVNILKERENTWKIGNEYVLQFTKGALSYIRRSWVTADGDAGEALFGAVGSLNRDGLSQCAVTAENVPSHVTLRERVHIDCGPKTVDFIRLTMPKEKIQVLVLEQIGTPRDEESAEAEEGERSW